jgi:hypothetical protein
MIYVLTGMSVLFVAIGFVVTENNAKYLLSGYNTLPEADRKKVDIKAYIAYFRKFHIFFGLSFLVLGALLYYFISRNVAGVFLVVYPVLAYIGFVATSAKYSKGLSTKWNKVGILILIGTLVFVTVLLGYGFKENTLTFDSQSIEFKGMYGETLSASQIASIELVNQIPRITLKTNGFALGSINKGYFKTEDGEIIKLILNSDNKPYILFTKADGERIYYSAKSEPNQKILDKIKQAFPGVVVRQ